MGKYYLDEAFNQLRKLENTSKENIEREFKKNIQQKRRQRRLDEAIPKDLAKAYKVSDSKYDRKSAVNPFYDNRIEKDASNDARGLSTVDWNKVNYKELTQDQALALPQKGRKNIRIIRNGTFVPLNATGTHVAGDRQTSYEDAIKNPPYASHKFYYTTDENPVDSPVSADKKARHYSLANGNWDDAQDLEYDSDLGKHLSYTEMTWQERHRKEIVGDLAKLKDRYEKALDAYHAGELTKKEFRSFEKSYQDAQQYAKETDRAIADTRRARHDQRIYDVEQYPVTHVMKANRSKLTGLLYKLNDVKQRLKAESESREIYDTGKGEKKSYQFTTADSFMRAQREVDNLINQIKQAQNRIDELTKRYDLGNRDTGRSQIDASITRLEQQVADAQKDVDTLLKRVPKNESFNQRKQYISTNRLYSKRGKRLDE